MFMFIIIVVLLIERTLSKQNTWKFDQEFYQQGIGYLAHMIEVIN